MIQFSHWLLAMMCDPISMNSFADESLSMDKMYLYFTLFKTKTHTQTHAKSRHSLSPVSYIEFP